jgi:hypothetical protein
MLSGFPFEFVISLGVDCRVRFQISRFFDALRALPPDERSLAGGEALAHALTGTNLFDWNMVWFSGVIKAIENRFDGLFIRDALKEMPKNATIVVDGRYEIMYSHIFSRSEGQTFADMIDAQYPKAAKLVLFLKDKLVSHFEAENPTIYIRCQGNEQEAQQFCQAMRANYPMHRFHLVLVDVQDATAGFVARHENYSIYRMTGKVNKPPEAVWTGDDEEWTALFRQIGDETRLPGSV